MIESTSTGEASRVQGLGDTPVSRKQLATHHGENVGDAPPYTYYSSTLPQRLHHPPINYVMTARSHTSAIHEEDVLSPDTIDHTPGILLAYSQ